MAGNDNLRRAKERKFDEFYTQYADIQHEINAYLEFDPDTFRDKTVLCPCDDPEWSNFTHFFAQNFESLGLKKLISTSYALDIKKEKYGFTDDDGLMQFTLFETESPQFDESISRSRGKIFTLERDKDSSGAIDIDDLEWQYLEGDGDFRSDEIKKLRDEADIIVTNPPFSLYRDFIAWIFEAEKKFIVIANKGSVSYKEVFPLIKGNKMWAGRTSWSGGMWFVTGSETDYDRIADGVKMKNVPTAWFTNLDHGRHHEPLQLMTMADNIKYSKHAKVREEKYPRYDNYDAIEVPFTDAIPDDFDGVMGVPPTFLEKYCPEQFEIIGSSLSEAKSMTECVPPHHTYEKGGPAFYLPVGETRHKRMPNRILIKRKR